MRNSIRLFALALLVLSGPAPAAAGDVRVIANSNVSSSAISPEDLKSIFLGAKTSFGGSTVEPVLAQQGGAHDEFLKEFVGKTDAALRNHFKSLVFTGKGSMPKSLPSDAAIVQYVAKTKGAIGYVSGSSAVTGVKVIQIQ